MKTLTHWRIRSHNERLNLTRVEGYDENKRFLQVEGVIVDDDGTRVITLDGDYTLVKPLTIGLQPRATL